MFLTIGVLLLTVLSPDHQWVSQFVSELAADGASHQKLARFGVFLPYASLIVMFAFGLFLTYRGSRPATFAALALALYSVSVGLGVIYNCDAGCPVDGATPSQVRHNYVTMIGIILLFMVPSGFAIHFKPNRKAYTVTVASMFLAAGILVLPGVFGSLEERIGLVQRSAYFVLMGWLLFLALYTLREEIDHG